jgi:predicted ester cyclase
MSAEQNIATFRQLIEEGFSQGNLEVLKDVFTPNFVEHQDGFVPPNAEGVKGAIVSLRIAAPDLKLTIEEITASGDKTWARITARGTHRGPFMGRPATERSFAIAVIDICRFENGKVVEHWGVADRLSMMAQLGLLPRPQ